MNKITELSNRILTACTDPNEDCAITSKVELIPCGGFDLNKIMPPTYSLTNDQKKALGFSKDDRISGYHIEERLHEGKAQKIVVLDSPQSAANRMEETGLAAREKGDLPMPDMKVQVKTLGRLYSVLEMPHRIFDAAVRDCSLDGIPFMDTTLGKLVYSKNHEEALRAIFETCRAVLILGGWCSHVGTTRALKFPRIAKSEVIAGLVSTTTKTGGRLDHVLKIEDILDIRHQPKTVGHAWELPDAEKIEDKAEIKKQAEEKKKAGVHKDKGKWVTAKVSEIGHGNIPPTMNDIAGGVSVSWIIDSFILSIHRTFRYATGNEKEDRLVRASLVCLALYLFLLKTQRYDLRSGCELRRRNKEITFNFEGYGDKPDSFTLTLEEAKSLYLDSLKPLEGIFDSNLTVIAQAQPKLEKLIQVSL